jgi:hypothetical protein
MAKFFEGINNKCSYFHGGCTHEDSIKGNSCNEDHCILLQEAGLVDPVKVAREAFITDLFEDLTRRVSTQSNRVTCGIGPFTHVVEAILKRGYKIVKKTEV